MSGSQPTSRRASRGARSKSPTEGSSAANSAPTRIATCDHPGGLHVEQPFPDARPDTAACHSLPQRGHCHHTRLPENGATAVGGRSPLRLGCHSAARSGKRSANDRPATTTSPAHAGQPVPSPVRWATVVAHAKWHVEHCHHTRLFELDLTASGRNGSFRARCHSPAMTGCSTAKDSAGKTRLPAQYGQPEDIERVRCFTGESHSCPQGPHHHTTRCVPVDTSPGRTAPLRVGCHCSTRSGRASARLTLRPWVCTVQS